MPGLLTGGPELTGPPAFAGQGKRKLWPLLLVLLFLLLLGYDYYERTLLPPTIEGWALTGPRGPACHQIVIGQDVSSSMDPYSTARKLALDSVLQWAKQDYALGDEDRIAVVDFGKNAVPSLPPQSVKQGAPAFGASGVDTSETNLGPLLDAVAGFPAENCETALLLLSDGIFSDPPGAAREGNDALGRHGVRTVHLLVPSAGITVPAEWARAFPIAPPIVFDGTNAGQTTLAIGTVLAGLTGQQLVPRDQPAP